MRRQFYLDEEPDELPTDSAAAVVPINIPPRLRQFNRRGDKPRKLDQYLQTCQDLRNVVAADPSYRALADAVALYPATYCKALHPASRPVVYRNVQVWPHANKTHPLTEVTLACRESVDRLHLIHIIPQHPTVRRERAELLMKAGLFFFLNWGLESTLSLVSGCKDAYNSELLSTDFYAQADGYRHAFHGKL